MPDMRRAAPSQPGHASQPRCAFGGCGALARSPQAPLHQIRAQPGLVRPGLTRLASTAHRWRLWIQSCRAAVEIGFQCRRGVRKDQFGMEGRACHQTGHGPHRHPDHHAHRPQRARDHTARTTAMVLQGLKRAQKSAGDKMDQVAASTGRSLSPVTRKLKPAHQLAQTSEAAITTDAPASFSKEANGSEGCASVNRVSILATCATSTIARRANLLASAATHTC